jgi:hypothetical protein
MRLARAGLLLTVATAAWTCSVVNAPADPQDPDGDGGAAPTTTTGGSGGGTSTGGSPPGCGDGVVDTGLGETCDPPSSCPTDCDDMDACTLDTLMGDGAQCDVQCTNALITTCNATADGCCPSACDGLSDPDCAVCNNMVLELGETCDPPGTCVTGCDDNDPCTTDTLMGSAMTCDVECQNTAITMCVNGDGCCPMMCNANNDLECAVHPDLVLFYTFEEGSGVANDLSITGNKTDGTPMGTVTYTTDAAVGNFALHSPVGSGANDRLQIAGNITDLDMTGPYTVMAWIKSSNASGGQGIINLGSCCTPRHGYTLNLQNGGTQMRFWGGSTGDDINYNSYETGTFANNTWIHVGYRVNTTSLEWRTNGVSTTTSTLSNLPTAPSMANANQGGVNNPSIGGQGISSAQGADVKIDEVRVYQKFLTDTEWTSAMSGMQ